MVVAPPLANFWIRHCLCVLVCMFVCIHCAASPRRVIFGRLGSMGPKSIQSAACRLGKPTFDRLHSVRHRTICLAGYVSQFGSL